MQHIVLTTFDSSPFGSRNRKGKVSISSADLRHATLGRFLASDVAILRMTVDAVAPVTNLGYTSRMTLAKMLLVRTALAVCCLLSQAAGGEVTLHPGPPACAGRGVAASRRRVHFWRCDDPSSCRRPRLVCARCLHLRRRPLYGTGDCNGIPEAQKVRTIVALREGETRAAWAVLAPSRDVPIDFLRGPDQGLVASSTVVDGVRQDVLSPAGASTVARAIRLATQLPPSVRSVCPDGVDQRRSPRPSHGVSRGARAAEILHQRQLDARSGAGSSTMRPAH